MGENDEVWEPDVVVEDLVGVVEDAVVPVAAVRELLRVHGRSLDEVSQMGLAASEQNYSALKKCAKLEKGATRNFQRTHIGGDVCDKVQSLSEEKCRLV